MNLNVISNNIANVNTHGFKKSKVEFQDMFYQTPTSVGADANGNVLPTGIQIGSGTQVVSTSKVFTSGQITRTDAELDLAIVGDGFFRVVDGNGNELYTRDGAFKVGPNGEILNSQGMTVTGFPAVPNGTTSIVINQVGGVTYFNQEAVLGQGDLQLARFNNPSGLLATGNNMFRETAASGAPQIGDPGDDGFGTLQQRHLEASNVNIVEEMVNMILAQRAYEINSRSIQTSDQMMQQVGQLKR